MSHRPLLNSPLQSRVIALPQGRRADQLAALFERRQATVLRVPLINIQDSPDTTAIYAWLAEFIENVPDIFVILTGEGLSRLLRAASRFGMRKAFIAAIGETKLLVRGPKPARVLAELNLQPAYTTTEATTDGVIAILKPLVRDTQRVAVQLYGEEPNLTLMGFLRANVGSTTSVAPYVYGSASDNSAVEKLILSMANDAVDFIAFTSKPQVNRLFKVAEDENIDGLLHAGLSKTEIAAVGPVVAAALQERGYRVSACPSSRYFMKPLVRAMEEMCERG